MATYYLRGYIDPNEFHIIDSKNNLVSFGTCTKFKFENNEIIPVNYKKFSLQTDGTFKLKTNPLYFRANNYNLKDNTLVTGEFYKLIDISGKKVKFPNGENIRLVPVKWYPKGKCNELTDTLEMEKKWIINNDIPKGFSTKIECERDVFYRYCNKDEKVNNCFGKCDSGDLFFIDGEYTCKINKYYPCKSNFVEYLFFIFLFLFFISIIIFSNKNGKAGYYKRQ